MEVGKLTVDVRNSSGKNESRRLRALGKVPGICYGLGADPLAIALEPRALKKALDAEKKQNTVIRMTVTGAPTGAGELTVMLKEYQVHPTRNDITHVDFVRIDVNKEVTVQVPLVFVGKMKGVVDGGQLHTEMRMLAVTAKPDAIPTKLEVDISPLDIGDVFHVSDIKLPAGVQAAADPGEAVVSCMAPQAEKVTAEEAAAAAAATEAAAAAPAAAGKPGAAPAKGAAPAAAEAKGGEKKK